jgi:hypothetical protein
MPLTLYSSETPISLADLTQANYFDIKPAIGFSGPLHLPDCPHHFGGPLVVTLSDFQDISLFDWMRKEPSLH